MRWSARGPILLPFPFHLFLEGGYKEENDEAQVRENLSSVRGFFFFWRVSTGCWHQVNL